MDTKKCIKCGIEKPLSAFHKNINSKDGLLGECKDCKKIYGRRYYQKNKKPKKEYAKTYYQDNKEAIAGYGKIYRQNNKEKICEEKKKYCQEHKEELSELYKKRYQNNKEAIIEKVKKYSQEHKEVIAERGKVYRQNNKEMLKKKAREYMKTPAGKAVGLRNAHKRRARKKGVLYEIFDPQEIFERDGWRCKHCHKKVQWLNRSPNHPLYPNLDHIIPLSKGGEHTKRNTQLLCRECNGKKHANDAGEQLRLFG